MLIASFKILEKREVMEISEEEIMKVLLEYKDVFDSLREHDMGKTRKKKRTKKPRKSTSSS